MTQGEEVSGLPVDRLLIWLRQHRHVLHVPATHSGNGFGRHHAEAASQYQESSLQLH